MSGRRRRRAADVIVSGTATCPGRIGRSLGSSRSVSSSAPQTPPEEDDDDYGGCCPSPAPESPAARTPSCPPSPLGRQAASRYMYLSSPLHSAASMGTRNSMSMSHYAGGLVSKMANKDDDAHGSSLSLVSTNSSLYSTTEEKQAHEIRKLRKQLDQANEKVATLTSQLTTNSVFAGTLS
ncbi:hypothetical protein HPB52_011325 [Rhipicephalus sanguineus]|uniref:Uncharacterized protein n=1 Tax=Rhipicephalus sanguineus TaxID=34632 RepID=A0A9D4PJI4_RHISA|nr:hypothetical protein HPB52_011325 [Rhipicephalus sanguineus]